MTHIMFTNDAKSVYTVWGLQLSSPWAAHLLVDLLSSPPQHDFAVTGIYTQPPNEASDLASRSLMILLS